MGRLSLMESSAEMFGSSKDGRVSSSRVESTVLSNDGIEESESTAVGTSLVGDTFLLSESMLSAEDWSAIGDTVGRNQQ